MYYRWLDLATADPNDRDWYIEFPVWCQEEWTMCDGKRVDNWRPEIIAQYPPYGTPVDFPVVLGDWHVHSAKLRRVLEQHVPNAVQYLPFRLQSSVGAGERNDYFVANHLALVDCLDREKSVVGGGSWKPVNPLGDFDIRVAVLSRKLIGAAKLFRVLGASGRVVLHQDLRKALDVHQITGCLFQPIELSD